MREIMILQSASIPLVYESNNTGNSSTSFIDTDFGVLSPISNTQEVMNHQNAPTPIVLETGLESNTRSNSNVFFVGANIGVPSPIFNTEEIEFPIKNIETMTYFNEKLLDVEYFEKTKNYLSNQVEQTSLCARRNHLKSQMFTE